jgi:hypothetical protein
VAAGDLWVSLLRFIPRIPHSLWPRPTWTRSRPPKGWSPSSIGSGANLDEDTLRVLLRPWGPPELEDKSA